EIVHGRTARAERGHNTAAGARSSFTRRSKTRPRIRLAALLVATGWTGGHPAVFRQLVYALFMQSDMNFLRSSDFIPFDFVLQAAILLSDSFFLLDRHVLMNFFRSSPFLSPASLLHAVILSCCALAPNTGAAPTANVANT